MDEKELLKTIHIISAKLKSFSANPSNKLIGKSTQNKE
jgi:hypothetical protein